MEFSYREKTSLGFLIVSIIGILLVAFNEVIADFLSPFEIGSDSIKGALGSLGLFSPIIIAIVLLIISVVKRNIVLRKIAYAIYAVIGLAGGIILIFQPLDGEVYILQILCIIATFLFGIEGILLFMSADKCLKWQLKTIIVIDVLIGIGIFTIIFLIPFIPGILLNSEHIEKTQSDNLE